MKRRDELVPETPVDLFAGLNIDEVVAVPAGGTANWKLRG